MQCRFHKGGQLHKIRQLSYYKEPPAFFLRATVYAKRAYAIAIPSVRLSVTRVDQPKTVEVTIMQFSPYSSSPIPLVFER